MKDGIGNLVLGCATGYSLEQILPFARSLRESGYDQDALLVVHHEQLPALQSLRSRYNIQLHPIHPAWKRLQNRGRMRHLHRWIARVAPSLCNTPAFLALSARLLRHFHHISNGRYLLYYDWLHRRQKQWKFILLTDVRDVAFQSDPFRYAKPGKLAFFLDPTVKLGDEPVNVHWVSVAYGEEYCKLRVGQRLACSGTTLGDAPLVIEYLKQMCIELNRLLPRIVGAFGFDQALHNFVLWEQCVPSLVIRENGEDAVMTLKNDRLNGLRFDCSGNLLNNDGSPAPVLHQYDFHPALAARFR